jgi:hypothetical protein
MYLTWLTIVKEWGGWGGGVQVDIRAASIPDLDPLVRGTEILK